MHFWTKGSRNLVGVQSPGSWVLGAERVVRDEDLLSHRGPPPEPPGLLVHQAEMQRVWDGVWPLQLEWAPQEMRV